MDSKTSNAGKSCKEDQSVLQHPQSVGCCSYSFLYSLSTALGIRHRRNSSLSASILLLHSRSFCLWQQWTTNTLCLSHLCSDFSIPRSLDLLLAATMLRSRMSGLVCMSRYGRSPYNHSTNLSSFWWRAQHGQRTEQRAASRMGTDI